MQLGQQRILPENPLGTAFVPRFHVMPDLLHILQDLTAFYAKANLMVEMCHFGVCCCLLL